MDKKLNVALLDAAGNGDIYLIQNLLDKGADANCVNEKGWTPLVKAAFNQHLNAVKLLVNAGAEINHQSVNGTTIFMYAKTKVMESGEYALLDYLIDEGADLEKRDLKKKWTVLEYVRSVGHSEMEQYLINKGAQK